MEAEVFSEENQKVVPKTLLDVNINDESTALKIMINYLTNAQKAGLFGFQESAKIWDALQQFVAKTEDVGSTNKTIDEGTRLLDINVNNVQDALHVIIGFMNILQRKGVFTLEEAGKIMSCINIFKNN
jgi:hypothetical protein